MNCQLSLCEPPHGILKSAVSSLTKLKYHNQGNCFNYGHIYCLSCAKLPTELKRPLRVHILSLNIKLNKKKLQQETLKHIDENSKANYNYLNRHHGRLVSIAKVRVIGFAYRILTCCNMF